MHADVHLYEDSGRIEIKALHSDLRAWATKPGAAWPCSTLAQCELGIVVTLDASNGDLLDLTPLKTPNRALRTGDPDVAADELTAFVDDALLDAAKLLLAARKTEELRHVA